MVVSGDSFASITPTKADPGLKIEGTGLRHHSGGKAFLLHLLHSALGEIVHQNEALAALGPDVDVTACGISGLEPGEFAQYLCRGEGEVLHAVGVGV